MIHREIDNATSMNWSIKARPARCTKPFHDTSGTSNLNHIQRRRKNPLQCQKPSRHERLTSELFYSIVFFHKVFKMPFGNSCLCYLGKCCGSRISIHWTFWFNFVFQLLFALIQHARSWRYMLLIATVWGPASLLSLVFHELGHIGITRTLRGSYSYSMVWPLGGFNDCTVPNGKCMNEFCIALGGPLMHLPSFFLWLLVLSLTADGGVSYYSTVGFSIDRLENNGASEWFAQLAKRTLDVNIMIFAINLLLPVYPMDAASMVAAICGHCGLGIIRIAWVMIILGAVLGVILLVVGILYIIAGDGPGIFLLLLGIYVLYNSWQMYGQVKAGKIDHHPVFQPDCYQSRNSDRLSDSRRPTSRSASSSRKPPQERPDSPRRSRSSSPRKAGAGRPTKSGSTKEPLPKRGDIEMGKKSPARTSKPKASAKGNDPKSSQTKKKKTSPKKLSSGV